MMKTVFFERITIIGLGLIGSSLARAIKERKLCRELHGVDRNSAHLNYALKEDIIHFAHQSSAQAVPESALVLICTPPSVIPDVIREIRPYLSPRVLVMDMASVKQPVAASIRSILGESFFYVPAHPIAGSERAGPEGGNAEMFRGRRVILCPEEAQLISEAVGVAKEFWEALGAKVEFMPADLHDRVYGYVSHLPQLLAFAARSAMAGQELQGADREILARFLRLSRSSGTLWADIFVANRDVVADAANHYLSVVGQVYNELTSGLVSGESSSPSTSSIARLFPRIAASALATTLSIAEPKMGTKLLPFAGTGLGDFASPVTDAPEEDIERIAAHYRDILPPLARYIQAVQDIKHLIEEQDSERLRSMLITLSQKVVSYEGHHL